MYTCEDVQCTYTVHVMIPIMKTGKNTPAGIGRATAMVVNTNYKKTKKKKLPLCFILYEHDKKVTVAFLEVEYMPRGIKTALIFLNKK